MDRGYGMEKVLLEKFDLAIVDVNMPKMDGFSLVRSLRGSAPAVATLVILPRRRANRIARMRGVLVQNFTWSKPFQR